MCHSDLTGHNPGVQRHSIEFCRHASSQTGRELTSTPSRQLSSSQTCIAGLNEIMEATKKEYPNIDNYLLWLCAVDYVLEEKGLKKDNDDKAFREA